MPMDSIEDLAHDPECEDFEPENASTISPAVSQDLKIADWGVLWALISTNGTQKLTKPQYQSVRNLYSALFRSSALPRVDSSLKSTGLPHFSTLYRTYRPLLSKYLLPRLHEVRSPVDTRKAGARATLLTSTNAAECRVQVILPSEYARLDMATPSVWSEMLSTSLGYCTHDECGQVTASVSTSECVDTWPLIAARQWFYGSNRALHLDTEELQSFQSSFAERDDVVKVAVDCELGLLEPFERCFLLSKVSTNRMVLQGTVLHFWTVHHSKRRGDPLFEDKVEYELSPRDLSIVTCLQFTDYVSPSDSVHIQIPELPVETNSTSDDIFFASDPNESSSRKRRVSLEMSEALKARRAALKKRKEAMGNAWREWKKPILKPGDAVCMLRPCSSDELRESDGAYNENPTLLTNIDKCSRMFVVSRFWTECGENSRHVFWIPGGAHIPVASNQLETGDVFRRTFCSSFSTSAENYILKSHEVRLKTMHAGKRGYAKFDPVSSVGSLSTGESYFVYRFLIFWDGFEVNSGTSASGDGFYLLCLNLPLGARSSPNAVRILSLTPPGAKSGVVLKRILDDVLVGMTTGYADFDAHGNKRRIFLDLVGVLGDTPALNYYLDILGHTATVCCHLCRFSRGPTSLLGSRYAKSDAHGMLSHTMRGFYQHCGVRDSGAKSETCKLLGMKAIESSNSDILFKFRSSMFEAKSNIPTTSSGAPVVPHTFDPYKGSLIAPDHVLTGHLRDCISLVLKLLPSKQYRVTCEKFMLDFLRQAKLPVQSRLIDYEKKALFSMTMSELYALGIVAESAFFAGCAYENRTTSNRMTISEKCREAISAVGSCARLISNLWHLPSVSIDGLQSVISVEKSNGGDTILKLQRMLHVHLEKVSQICSMHDDDVLLMEDAACPRGKRVALSKAYRETLVALKTIDKPNLHRLRELFHTTLPMVGFVGRIGELVLEKTHQILKRAIRLSNNKEVQAQCMHSAAFNDWQGRLSTSADEARKGHESALRCCFRLLSGQDALAKNNGTPTQSQISQVLEVLGPDGLIVSELTSQSRSVLSPRALTRTQSQTWALLRGPSTASGDSTLQILHREILRSFSSAFSKDLNSFDIASGEKAVSSYLNSQIGRCFKRGDVVEVLCYYPHNNKFHVPFLVQVQSMRKVPGWEKFTGLSLWCILGFVELTPKTGSPLLYAAVQPCLRVQNVVCSASTEDGRMAKYRLAINQTFSFAKMDDTMRACGTMHTCIDLQCAPNAQGKTVDHCEDTGPLSGCNFVPLTRSTGYPPRQG